MYVITFGGFMGNYGEELNRNLILMPTRIIGTYILTYLILPFALKKKQFLLFSFLVVAHALIFGFFIWLTLSSFHYSHKNPDYSAISLFNPIKILGTLFSNYVVPVAAVAVVIFKKWYLDEKQKTKLAKEKLTAELNFLKSQIHPHFLFNTLNNLYALTLIKSEKTPEVVLKLSGLLDYMIYKSNDKFVPLTKELEILTNYIELEELRYNNRLDLEHKLIGDPGSHKIAPLILLPFIENSFKHGASNDRTNPKIRIKLEIDNDCLHLQVVNSIMGEKQDDKTLGEGIGLRNVKRRLELIYPSMHKLDIQQHEKEFEVNLEICWSNE
jgi:sensor histidine kinase YesM